MREYSAKPTQLNLFTDTPAEHRLKITSIRMKNGVHVATFEGTTTELALTDEFILENKPDTGGWLITNIDGTKTYAAP